MSVRGIAALMISTALVAVGCAAPRAAATPTAAAPSGAAASAEPDFSGKTLNIATGATGAVYIIYGAGIADLLSKKLKVAASSQSTPASVDNMKLIRDGKADLALTQSDIAFDAVNAKGRFAPPEGKVDTKTLAVMYTNYLHLVTKDGSPINTVSDLKGKRVSMGPAGSGTEVKATRVLEAYGMTPADVQVQRLSSQEAADAMRDGKLDAFFFDGGLPIGAVLDLSTSMKIKLIDQSEAIKKMQDKYGAFYFAAKIPKETYKTSADVVTAGVANLLVVPSSFDPKLASAIVRTIYDNRKDLELVHPAALELKLETMTVGSPIDFHPGAIDFYKSRNAWKP
jgi:TRAP transporter TAXI family solute receptor